MLQSAYRFYRAFFPLAERKNKVEHKPHDQPLDAHLHLQMEENWKLRQTFDTFGTCALLVLLVNYCFLPKWPSIFGKCKLCTLT